jgi:hypothetical protein
MPVISIEEHGFIPYFRNYISKFGRKDMSLCVSGFRISDCLELTLTKTERPDTIDAIEEPVNNIFLVYNSIFIQSTCESKDAHCTPSLQRILSI